MQDNAHVAPILLFVFKKIDPLKRTIDSLKLNPLSIQSELIIFSDQGISEADKECVSIVRRYLKTIQGFKSIIIYEAQSNLGLANSIISGVNKVFDKYNRVIVLEDDLLLSTNFLQYMNQALDFYENNSSIFSIAGFTPPIKNIFPDDIYFTKRSSSWGWATWKDRWSHIDWLISDYDVFQKNSDDRYNFNKMGSDMSSMLDRQMLGKINSWAIRWCYHQFKYDLYTVYPSISKVINIGLGDPSSTHTYHRFNRFQTVLDDTNIQAFNFTDNILLNPRIIKQFLKPYSLRERIRYKILNSFF